MKKLSTVFLILLTILLCSCKEPIIKNDYSNKPFLENFKIEEIDEDNTAYCIRDHIWIRYNYGAYKGSNTQLFWNKPTLHVVGCKEYIQNKGIEPK